MFRDYLKSESICPKKQENSQQVQMVVQEPSDLRALAIHVPKITGRNDF